MREKGMSMKERISRAIAERRNARRVKDGGEDIGVLPIDFADADAVLAAMREPTGEMIMAGIIERHETGTPEAWKLATANIYTAMIDAASRDSGSDRNGEDTVGG